jgi:hypothetical protein
MKMRFMGYDVLSGRRGRKAKNMPRREILASRCSPGATGHSGGTPHSCGSEPAPFNILPDKSGVPAETMHWICCSIKARLCSQSRAGGVQSICSMPLAEPCIYNPLKRQPLFHVWSRKPRPISERASARRSGNKCGGRDDGFNAKNPTGHVVTFYDLTGLIGDFSAGSAMRKTKPARRFGLQPLETGQIWRMAELNLRVELVGKWLVHYKLAKPDAVRTANSCSGITAVRKYLKKNKAVLVSA